MRRALDRFAVPLFLIAAFDSDGCGSSSGGGSNSTTTVPPVTIGPSGGTFNDGAGVIVTVPAGALSANTQISATRTNTPGASGYGNPRLRRQVVRRSEDYGRQHAFPGTDSEQHVQQLHSSSL